MLLPFHGRFCGGRRPWLPLKCLAPTSLAMNCMLIVLTINALRYRKLNRGHGQKLLCVCGAPLFEWNWPQRWRCLNRLCSLPLSWLSLSQKGLLNPSTESETPRERCTLLQQGPGAVFVCFQPRKYSKCNKVCANRTAVGSSSELDHTHCARLCECIVTSTAPGKLAPV